MAKFKDFSFFYGENEKGQKDSIASILIEPGELILDPAGQHSGQFMEMDISREKLKAIVKELDDDFEKLIRHQMKEVDMMGAYLQKIGHSYEQKIMQIKALKPSLNIREFESELNKHIQIKGLNQLEVLDECIHLLSINNPLPWENRQNSITSVDK